MSPGMTLRGLGVVVALIATLTGMASASPTSHAPVVATTEGLVRGIAAEGNDQFLGIPYAAPPVGALRWRPPQPAARWAGVRDATKVASSCAQPAGAFGQASVEEDCLYLNVHAPAGRANPVMVWLHGGALVSGSGGVYDPTELVRNGVVVVTINYRLGALGFLAHPALADRPGGASGNYGLMDQQAALRWVARNIARFGGNPHDVTVFGESAGGLSVLSQLVSPGARGLVDRAIVQSGAYSLTQEPLAAAEAAGQAYAAATGCADQSAACLRGLPVSTVLAEQSSDYVPNLDGRVLTQSLGTAFASGQFARVPIVNGSNRDEWRLFVALDELAGRVITADNYLARIAEFVGGSEEVAAAVAEEYPLSAYPSPALAFSAMGTDVVFACPALTVNNMVSQYVPTFGYEFNDQSAPELLPPVSFPQGAAHAAELQYLFRLPIGGPLTPDQERLATSKRRYWTSFAEHGTPRGLWPRFEPATHRLLSLVPPRPQVVTDFAVVHNCDFWTSTV
jgi:para-nitrobenzyl esterase